MPDFLDLYADEQFHGKLLQKLNLAKFNTWHVGGIADLVYKPNDVGDLQNFLKKVYKLDKNIPMYWLGLGSNVLIRDGGIRGLVILTNTGSKGGLTKLDTVEDKIIKCEAGVPCAKLAKYLVNNNYPNGAFLAGIPGTIGGALAMNAGCYNHETWDYVVKVEVINRRGEVIQLTRDDFIISYRTVKNKVVDDFINEEYWFVRGFLSLLENKDICGKEEIKNLLQKRNNQQPIGLFSGGSVFRNPPGGFAAKLIEDSGLKGFTIGGAHVSTKHANFIINDKTATAKDIELLIIHVQKTVFEKFGVQLEPEVIIIGDELNEC